MLLHEKNERSHMGHRLYLPQIASRCMMNKSGRDIAVALCQAMLNESLPSLFWRIQIKQNILWGKKKSAMVSVYPIARKIS